MGKSTTEVAVMADGKPKQMERAQWDNKTQYLLSCVGFAVGLGNIWRFPYLCQTYGGGAFLIPYFIALFLEGIPLLYLEMCIGQRLRSSCIGVWSQIHPCLVGLGIANMLSSIFIAMYYNTIVAWILWYFFQSFQETLPWTYCPVWANGSGMEMECAQSSPVQYFWYRKTLNISPQLEDSGSLQWWLVLCLCTAWLIIYVCTSRSIETTGKAVYVTGPFPYVILFCFLVRGVTLEGATDGLVYLFTPDVEILKQPEVWMNAATQIFFSLSVGFGGMIAFSSYNPIKNDCEMDAVIVALINSATSIFASIPVFSVLGFKATISLHNCLDKNIKLLMNEFDVAEGTITRDSYTHWFSVYNATNPDRVNSLDLAECSLNTFLNQAASGTGLVFIIFTEAIVNMPLPQLWSVLFFIMLCMLGMSSMFGNVEGVLTPLLDLKVFPPSWPKELIQGLICLVFLLLSLVFTLASGNYWLTVFNDFAGSIPLLFVGFFEAIAVAHIFGYNRFSKDMKKMVGRTPNWYWKLTLCFISPCMLAVIFVAYIVQQALTPLTYDAWNPSSKDFPKQDKLQYPPWMIFIIIVISGAGGVAFVVAAVYQYARGRTEKPDIPSVSDLINQGNSAVPPEHEKSEKTG